ncbi:hypothetical protein RZS08_48540, partial [Arthrospira platensis SPKY1]|nr:hypothetical protein [Arthrospira platensis SPKY1]
KHFMEFPMSEEKEPPEFISLVLGVAWLIAAIFLPTVVSESQKGGFFQYLGQGMFFVLALVALAPWGRYKGWF